MRIHSDVDHCIVDVDLSKCVSLWFHISLHVGVELDLNIRYGVGYGTRHPLIKQILI